MDEVNCVVIVELFIAIVLFITSKSKELPIVVLSAFMQFEVMSGKLSLLIPEMYAPTPSVSWISVAVKPPVIAPWNSIKYIFFNRFLTEIFIESWLTLK